MRMTLACVVLGAVAVAACDSGPPGSSQADGRTALAALSVLPSGSRTATEDTLPIVLRRVWFTNDADVWGSPPAEGRFLPVTDWSGPGSGGAVAVRDLVTGENRRVTPDPDPFPSEYAENSAISRDGRRIAYLWWSDERGYELRVIDVDGSNSRVLYEDPSFRFMPVGWSWDGESVLVFGVDNRDNLIGLVSADDGSLRVLKRLGQRHPVGVAISPDGRYVAYDDNTGADPQRDIYVVRVATGEVDKLVEDPADDLVFGWAPDGSSVLFASDRTGTMGAWLLPVADGRASGPPGLVKHDLWRAQPMGFDGDGAFYYVVWMHMSDVFLATVDQETGQLLDSPTRVSSRYQGSNGGPEWSPDGSQLAYFSERKQWREFGSDVIVIRSTRTGEERELHPSLDGYMHPRWSPDGRFLLVRARDETGRGFFRVDIQTGAVEPLIRFPEGSGNIASRAEWIDDGNALLYWWWPHPSVEEGYIAPDDRPPRTLRIRDLETGEEQIVFEGVVSPRFAVSPDRQRVAFSSLGEGQANLMVMPVHGGEPREVLGGLGESQNLNDHPSEIQWSPDGRYLFYADSQARSLWRVPADGGEPEQLDWLEENQALPFIRFQPGGSRVALSCYEGEGGGEVWVMEGFLPDPEAAGEERREP
jgi:Tol biopolymer transport system component